MRNTLGLFMVGFVICSITPNFIMTSELRYVVSVVSLGFASVTLGILAILEELKEARKRVDD